MPRYVRRPYTRRKSASTFTKAGRIYKSRFKNKRVDAALRRPRGRMTVDQRQNKGIYTLGRQVRSLQLAQLGDKQYQKQSVVLRANFNNNVSMLTPVAFCANNFHNGTNLWIGQVITGQASFEALHATTGTGAPITFQKQVFDIDLSSRYDWLGRNNQATVSKLEYLPIFMNYKFRITGQCDQSEPVTTYRFTFFKCKRMPNADANPVCDFQMPTSLGAYWRMEQPDPSTRNSFSKSYHKILMDKRVTIYPPTGGNDSTKSVDVTVNMPYAFKSAKPLKPLISNSPAPQVFWTTMPSHELIWCLISNDRDVGITNPYTLTCERGLTWRDGAGAMA